MLVVEDIDMAAQFCIPESPAFDCSVFLYIESARRRGCDANIGRRLPHLLSGAGFAGLNISVSQPAALEGELKLIQPITFENIRQAALAEGFSTEAENASILNELYRLANDPDTFLSLPRIVQVFGTRPAA